MMQTLKVLLLEDNVPDADFLQDILLETSTISWKITHVERLSDALCCIEQAIFDIVLSDLSLPDAQGLDTVTRLQTMAPNLPIVVLTGWDDEAIGLAALRQGAQDYLIKGQIQQHLLTRTIRYAIERSHTQQVMRQQLVAMSASREGIAILNPNRQYIYVNQTFAKLYGYIQPEHLIGTSWSELHQQSNYAALEQQINTAIHQQGYWQGETVAHRCNGEEFYQELSIIALNDGGVVCNVRDITERKQAEIGILKALARERELNEFKSRFVTIVSHEFRTPLSVILSSTEILQRYSQQSSEDKNQARFNRIINGVQRMSQLLDDVLMVNKAEGDRLDFCPVLFDPVQLAQALVEELRWCHPTHTITFIGSVHRFTCYLDEQLLRSILTNLISNAVKFSPEGSGIQVEVIGKDSQLMIRVQDWGIGIPAADMQQIFMLFHRGSNVGTIPGAGLGLSIVKQCVDRQGGTIAINSEVNQGTELVVMLPVWAGA